MWFFNPKNVTISPGIDQNQKWLIGQNLPFFNEISLQPTKILNSDVKWAFSDSRVKRWQFFVLINARANGYIFRVNKSQISLRSAFLRQPLHLFLAILKQVQFCLQKKRFNHLTQECNADFSFCQVLNASYVSVFCFNKCQQIFPCLSTLHISSISFLILFLFR